MTTILTTGDFILKHFETCFFGVQSRPLCGCVGPLAASGFLYSLGLTGPVRGNNAIR